MSKDKKTRFLSVFLPTWSIDLTQRRMRLAVKQLDTADRSLEALLLVTKHAGTQLVARRSEKAKEFGVWVGMNLANARALVPHAAVYPFDPVYEENALYKLAEWAYAFSPVAAPDKTPTERLSAAITDPRYSGIMLDASGNERLFGSEKKLIKKISQELSLIGFRSRIAVTPTIGASWALARYGVSRCSTTPASALRAALAPLPVTALRIKHDTEQALFEVNIRRVEHLFNIPRKSLAARFGMEIGKRLDQAFGYQSEALEAVRVSPHLQVEKFFDGGTTQFEALLFGVSELLKQLLDTLEAQHKKVSLLELEIKTVDCPTSSQELRLNSPSSNKKHIWSLLQQKLERFNMGFGVEYLALRAPQQEDIIPQRTSYLEIDSHNCGQNHLGSELGELIDVIHNALGSNSVLQFETTESFIPEKAFSHKPISAERLGKAQTELPLLIKADRPSVLFRNPQPIRAMAALPDSPPTWLKWREKKFRLQNGLGPERIAPAWWGESEKERFGAPVNCTRDYFKVQLPSGMWLWVFRETDTSNWFIHGLWA